MTLEQHFYTSGKPEFITVAITDGISREECIQLETNSIYFLPMSLHYQENITTPVKYIWYPLGEDHFAVGRAIYKGKDSLGRTGNYLFHNYVFNKDDLMATCDTNPITLIKWLKLQRVFRDDAPTQEIQPFELSSDAIPLPTPGLTGIPHDLMERVLHVCLEHETLYQPLLLLGTENESLDFLERLYMVLPYDVRLALRVDTYAYGVSLGFPIIGSLDDETFSQGLASSLTLRLSNLEATIYAEFPTPSRYLQVLTEKALEGERPALDVT